jgi:hypothetical protein
MIYHDLMDQNDALYKSCFVQYGDNSTDGQILSGRHLSTVSKLSSNLSQLLFNAAAK